jgi:hypothetical protein
MTLTTVNPALLDTQAQYTGFKNRIINGAMVIDQRNAGAAVTTSSSFPVDRFIMNNATDGAFSAQQNASAPTGFVNSLKLTTTTADATLAGTQNLHIAQKIEGFNIADLAWGTANAATVALSFWARSSLTGTFGGALRNATDNRSYAFTYSISAVDTWEYKTVVIPGDTTGTWLSTNGVGVSVFFGLGAGPDRSGTAGAWASTAYVSATGAVSVVGTLNATFYITGVQLEKGSTATSFDYRPYGTEMPLCQRYYEKMFEPFGFGRANGSPAPRFFARFTVQKRAIPTCTGVGSFSCSDMFTVDTVQSAAQGASVISDITTNGLLFGFLSSTLINSAPFSNGVVCANLTSSGAFVTASSEL